MYSDSIAWFFFIEVACTVTVRYFYTRSLKLHIITPVVSKSPTEGLQIVIGKCW